MRLGKHVLRVAPLARSRCWVGCWAASWTRTPYSKSATRRTACLPNRRCVPDTPAGAAVRALASERVQGQGTSAPNARLQTTLMDGGGEAAAAADVDEHKGDTPSTSNPDGDAACVDSDRAAASAAARIRALWLEVAGLVAHVSAVTEEGEEDADACDQVAALARAVGDAGARDGGVRAADDVEVACGRPLTPELRAYIEAVDVGSECEALILEGGYTLYSRGDILKQITSMAGHDFAARHAADPARYTPLELKEAEQQVQFVWWDRGWVPIAQDSGGNMVCVDLHPGQRGELGQVIGWEARMGPVGPFASSLGEYLTDSLLSGLRSGATVFCEDEGGLVARDDL